MLASLNHPNIAAIYGIESNALVMEFVDVAPDGRFLINVPDEATSSIIILQNWKPPSSPGGPINMVIYTTV